MGKSFLEYIRDKLGSLRHLGHLPFEELLHLRCYLLVDHIVVICVVLFLYPVSVQCPAELVDEKINGSAVAHEMMHVRKQHELIRLYDLEADHGTL